jgi:hypothetical protein
MFIRTVVQSGSQLLTLFLAGGFFYPEDGGGMFLQNVGSHKTHTAPHPRRRPSSRKFCHQNHKMNMSVAAEHYQLKKSLASSSCLERSVCTLVRWPIRLKHVVYDYNRNKSEHQSNLHVDGKSNTKSHASVVFYSGQVHGKCTVAIFLEHWCRLSYVDKVFYIFTVEEYMLYMTHLFPQQFVYERWNGYIAMV